MFWYVLLAFVAALWLFLKVDESEVEIPMLFIAVISAVALMVMGGRQISTRTALEDAQAHCEVLKTEEVCNEYEIKKRTFVDYFKWPFGCNKGDK